MKDKKYQYSVIVTTYMDADIQPTIDDYDEMTMMVGVEFLRAVFVRTIRG